MAHRLFDVVAAYQPSQRLGGAALLVLVLIAVAFASRASLHRGPAINAEVVRFASRPVGGGDRPVVIVRLPDGTIDEALARPEVVRNCEIGSSISVVRSSAPGRLQVGVRGCIPKL